MKTKYFEKAIFWTRELRLPLFWLPRITQNNSLTFYKNSILHIYYLGDRNIKSAELGYKFFTKKSNVAKYEREIKSILSQIDKIKTKYKSIKINKISIEELEKSFFAVVDFLTTYSDTYMRTEAVYLAKFETEFNKYGRLMKKLGELRFHLRKKGESLFYILLGILLKEIGKRFKISGKDLFFYTYSEMKRLFKKKKANGIVVQNRSKGYALLILNNKELLFVGEKFRKLFKEIVLVKKSKELTGMVAMKGKVKGKARLILHSKRVIAKDVAKFKKGEILVTEMTRPDTVLACRKAVAIITDEGGITSHAAIIAREFKIPCVVGTKIATQIIKTGDLVEINGDTGVVSILK